MSIKDLKVGNIITWDACGAVHMRIYTVIKVHKSVAEVLSHEFNTIYEISDQNNYGYRFVTKAETVLYA